MKKILAGTVLLFFAIEFNAQAVDSLNVQYAGSPGIQDSNSQKKEAQKVDSLLHDAVIRGQYIAGMRYVAEITDRDSISISLASDCAECYIGAEKFSECIDFGRSLTSRFPDAGFERVFELYDGECYYYLKDYAAALEHFDRYFDTVDISHGSTYYKYLYARTLYGNHLYTEAAGLYCELLNQIASEERVSVESLYKAGSDRKRMAGNCFYDLSYILFYSGEEVSGKGMLELAKKCGNYKASSDLAHLEQSGTFAQAFNIKRKYYRQFDEYIDRYDIKCYVAELYGGDNTTFWEALQSNCRDYQQLLSGMSKRRLSKPLRRSLAEINSYRDDMNRSLAALQPYDKTGFEESMELNLFGEDVPIDDFRIYPATEQNAFATPFGQVYLTRGLVDSFHSNYDLLLGVCAHEATHYLCQHSLTRIWAHELKTRRNKIWAAVLIGLNTGIALGTGIYAATNGVPYDQRYWDDYWDSVIRTNNMMFAAFALDSYYFQFKYDRDQEIESDIIAYRFCEYMGISGYAYIMALQLLGDDSLYLTAGNTDDHPTLTYRVLLLKYLYDKDHPRK